MDKERPTRLPDVDAADRIERVIAFVVAAATFRLVWSSMVASARGEVGSGGVAFMLLAGLAGVVGSVFFTWISSRFEGAVGKRMIVWAAAVLYVVLSLLPLLEDEAPSGTGTVYL